MNIKMFGESMTVLERTKHQSFTWFNHHTTPRKLREEIQQTLGSFCQVYGERNQKIRFSSFGLESLGFRNH